jgi:hypothetical protein
MSVSGKPQPTVERRIVADGAREIRLRLRASRLAVSKNLDEMARGARGVKLADHLSEMADAMLSGPWTVEEAEEAAARMARQIVQARARRAA